MKASTLFGVIAVGSALATLHGNALAADGAICFSAPITMTASGGVPSTTNYPQLTNNHKFYCPGGAFTFKQLSQAGWIIQLPVPVISQTTVSSNGTVTTTSRWMIAIQK